MHSDSKTQTNKAHVKKKNERTGAVHRTNSSIAPLCLSDALLCSIVNCQLSQLHVNIETINREQCDDTWTCTDQYTQRLNPLPSVWYPLSRLHFASSAVQVIARSYFFLSTTTPRHHSYLLSALCGGLACVNMTDWASVGPLIASFHGCESVLWSGRVNKMWVQGSG